MYMFVYFISVYTHTFVLCLARHTCSGPALGDEAMMEELQVSDPAPWHIPQLSRVLLEAGPRVVGFSG